MNPFCLLEIYLSGFSCTFHSADFHFHGDAFLGPLEQLAVEGHKDLALQTGGEGLQQQVNVMASWAN